MQEFLEKKAEVSAERKGQGRSEQEYRGDMTGSPLIPLTEAKRCSAHRDLLTPNLMHCRALPVPSYQLMCRYVNTLEEASEHQSGLASCLLGVRAGWKDAGALPFPRSLPSIHLLPHCQPLLNFDGATT